MITLVKHVSNFMADPSAEKNSHISNHKHFKLHLDCKEYLYEAEWHGTQWKILLDLRFPIICVCHLLALVKRKLPI